MQGGQHGAVIGDAFFDCEPITTGDVWGSHVLVGIPQVIFGGTADLQDVAEAARGDQTGAGQAARDQGIGGDRRAVTEQLYLFPCHSSLANPVKNPPCRVCRHGRDLHDRHLPGLLVEQDEIGEGSSDIGGDTIA